ncbi:MAG: inositol monophosphatase family protein, partial [Alphaproteobacteria bacterium]|nr:inositol monophosphatase family protein [Alphaproteobacteria bacterium]
MAYEYLQDQKLLQETVKEAGKIALSYFKKNVKSWLKADASPVSEADMAVNDFLEKTLRSARPEYGWISEESELGNQNRLLNQQPIRYFIVDPIDGTRGFLANDPHWCVSVAVAEAGKIVVAAIFCPALDEFYSTIVGEKLLINDEEVFLEPIEEKERGFAVISAPRNLEPVIKDKLHKNIIFHQHISSLAYSVVLCALSAIDCVVIRPSCKEWDIAAADLILRN